MIQTTWRGDKMFGRFTWGLKLISVAFYLFEAFLVVLSHSCFRTSIPSNSPSPDSGEKQRSSITTNTKGRGKARPG